MSQLNNENKGKNKLLLFIIIFFIIAVISTGILIYFNLSNKDGNKVEINNNIKISASEKALAVKALDEMYYPNSIKVKEEKYTEGSKVKVSDWYTTDKLTVSYLSISGLKDKKVEEKINKLIKDTVLEFYTKEELNQKDVQYISIQAYVSGNFSDVLSISIDKYIYRYDDKLNSNSSKGLNIRLDTGESIKFEDLFLRGTNIKSIIANAVYHKYAYENFINLEDDEEYNPVIDYSKVDFSTYDDEVSNIINRYEYNGISTFSFTPKDVYLCIAGKEPYCVTIDIEAIYDKVAIYKRFKKDNLYEKNTTKKQFVFTDIYQDYLYEYGPLDDNLFVDVRFFPDIDGESRENVKTVGNKLIKDIKESLDKDINDFKKTAKEDKKNGYVYYVDYYFVSYSNRFSLTKYFDYYKININEYKSNGLKLIANALKQKGYYEYFQYFPDCVEDKCINKNITLIKNEVISQEYDLEGKLIENKDGDSQEPSVDENSNDQNENTQEPSVENTSEQENINEQ